MEDIILLTTPKSNRRQQTLGVLRGLAVPRTPSRSGQKKKGSCKAIELIVVGLNCTTVNSALNQITPVLDKYRLMDDNSTEDGCDIIPDYIQAIVVSKYAVDYVKIKGGSLEEMRVVKDILEKESFTVC